MYKKYFSSIVFKINVFSLIASFILACTISGILSVSAREKLEESVGAGISHNLSISSKSFSDVLSDLRNFSYFLSSDVSVHHFLTSKSSSDISRQKAMAAYDSIRGHMSTMPDITDYLIKVLVSTFDERMIVLGTSGGTFSDVKRYFDLPETREIFNNDQSETATFSNDVFLNSTAYTYDSLLYLPIGGYIYRAGSNRKIGWYYVAVDSALFAGILNRSCDASSEIFIKLSDAYYELQGNTFIPTDRFICDSEADPSDIENSRIAQLDGHDITVLENTSEEQNFSIYQVMPPVTDSSFPYIPLRSLIIIIAAFVIFYLLLSLFLRWLIVKPVKRMTHLIARISSGDFSIDSSVEGNDELGAIGHGINQMSENISTLIDSKIDNEKQKRQLELMSLQYQINPHFLYNTLGSIKWMAMMQGADGITKMTDDLISLYRSIAKHTSPFISLGAELEFLEKYTDLLSYRYGNSFSYSVSIDDPVLLDAQMLKFTLQPIVENAIFHGLEGQKGDGSVKLNASRKGSDLQITVTDNGIGMTQEQINTLMNASKGDKLFSQVGIQNINQRIQLEFGEEYGISIESHLEEYTCVSLTFPYITPSEMEKINVQTTDR